MHNIIISRRLFTEDNAVLRNDSSSIIVRSKSFPPVSLLLTETAIRMISARSLGTLSQCNQPR